MKHSLLKGMKISQQEVKTLLWYEATKVNVVPVYIYVRKVYCKYKDGVQWLTVG